MSRRDFFGKIVGKDHGSSVFTIGRVGDYPIGEKKFLSQHNIYVESLSEGIRVQSSSNENIYFAIKENQFGELTVDCSESWPAEAVLSIMTNEPIYLDKSKEDSL